jgi:hypothetical protein
MTVVITEKHTPEPIGAKVSRETSSPSGKREKEDLTLARTGHS